MDAKVNPLWICTNRGQITIESPEPCLQNMRVNVKNMTLKPLTGCFARDGRPIRLSTSPMLAKSPNRQAAVAYLAACNATAITIVDRDGIGVIIAKGTVRGQMVDRHSGCPAHGRAGRRCAGESPDMATAIAAVQRSAGSCRPLRHRIPSAGTLATRLAFQLLMFRDTNI